MQLQALSQLTIGLHAPHFPRHHIRSQVKPQSNTHTRPNPAQFAKLPTCWIISSSRSSPVRAQAPYGKTREAGFRGSSYAATIEDPAETNMRNMVAKRLHETASHFKRMGSLGFWSQFLCTLVSAGILAFSIFITGTVTAPVTKYLTATGIALGFISVFWSFGYMRLSGRLEGAVGDPSKAPPRTEVVDKLKTGLVLNVLGMASTVVGLQATVGLLVAKALNSPAAPFLHGPYAGQSPVLALDVFLVQACANALLSHFLGLLFNLELLRSVSNKPPPQQKVILQTS